ncbi:hypothetical protein DYD21_02090 [Rhodohalobacter sp. SW132]|uniref:antibiotic biosynthesis monooxygenase n=1 Tax=Rhodohalobacter sp. SW132 TaxID=2293433 RepID=UPI000E24640F|nr:antibiotic biosynthesis monooxygenase [Rhodohalobacter sp. SW132]REL38764.1 hypothetical protein DYD21_02090 [Rhodohalobacter sp. SW132]
MHLRMVEAAVNKDGDLSLEHLYAEKIIPALEHTAGCIFAGLLQREDQPSHYISLTLWRNENDADSYVHSGEYQKNLQIIEHTLEESDKWKIQLSKDNIVEYTPVEIEPEVKSFTVAKHQDVLPPHLAAKSSYLRILSLKIKSGQEDEFKKIYSDEILPQLESVNGCQFAFLLDNSSHNGEMISLTIWDDAASLDYYEKEGLFNAFMGRLKHTLGDLYRWKMALKNRTKSATAVTSQDIGVSKYTMITGKKFE